jgi:hypothetical protein
MVVFKEDQKLDEMAILRVSTKDDGLPFYISVLSPETHHPPHAVVMDLKTGKQKLGEFLIPKSLPHKSSDIKDYRNGITDDMRQLVFEWLPRPNKIQPKLTNFEGLWFKWSSNEDI